MKKETSYLKKHVAYTSIIHLIGGIGIGVLITYPLAGTHPVRWGIALLAISFLGHIYAWFAKN